MRLLGRTGQGGAGEVGMDHNWAGGGQGRIYLGQEGMEMAAAPGPRFCLPSLAGQPTLASSILHLFHSGCRHNTTEDRVNVQLCIIMCGF